MLFEKWNILCAFFLGLNIHYRNLLFYTAG